MKKKGQKQQKKGEKKELVEKDTNASADADDVVDADDEEVNSGFGSYLSSATGS